MKNHTKGISAVAWMSRLSTAGRMVIDRETGYDDTITCECSKCSACDGEGGHFQNYLPGPSGDVFQVDTAFIECSKCKGTGKDKDDCPVHVEA